MGSPQTDNEAVSTQTVAPTTESQSAIGPAHPAYPTAALVSELLSQDNEKLSFFEKQEARLAALEAELKSVVESIKGGLHNRVNELEQTLKRRFPYG